MPDDLDVLKNLDRELTGPDERSVKRARSLLGRRARPREGLRVPRELATPSSLGAVAAATLLIGCGLGFGIASFVTSTLGCSSASNHRPQRSCAPIGSGFGAGWRNFSQIARGRWEGFCHERQDVR